MKDKTHSVDSLALFNRGTVIPTGERIHRPRGDQGYGAHECGRPSVLSRHRHQAELRLSEHPSADRSERACGPDDCEHRALPLR